MKEELAHIAIDKKQRISGFKVLGVFPFYLKYIRVDTHIELCVIKESINALTEKEPDIVDFWDAKLMREATPLLIQYCLTALLNNRRFSRLYTPILLRKLKACSHYHLFTLYNVIFSLNEPAFFLAYWKPLRTVESTILKEVKQS